MSCFIVSPENVRAQAEFIACLLNEGYTNRYRMGAPEALQEALKACKTDHGYSAHKIYRALYIANLKAYNGRYKENVMTFDRYKQSAPPSDLLQLHKYMRCWIYQCSEDATYSTPLYTAVLDLSQALAERIVSGLPEYDEKNWG